MHIEWKQRVYGRAVEYIIWGRLTPSSKAWMSLRQVRISTLAEQRVHDGCRVQRWETVHQESVRTRGPVGNSQLIDEIQVMYLIYYVSLKREKEWWLAIGLLCFIGFASQMNTRQQILGERATLMKGSRVHKSYGPAANIQHWVCRDGNITWHQKCICQTRHAPDIASLAPLQAAWLIMSCLLRARATALGSATRCHKAPEAVLPVLSQYCTSPRPLCH